MVRGGVEPPTFRFSSAIGRSWTVAGRRLISQLPAPIVAVGRPASVTACLRWLPIWLSAVGDPAVIGLHISGVADRSLNSRPSRQLSPVPDHRGLQRGLHHVQQRRLQLTHNLPSCLAHAAVPLMINRQEARGCTCCTHSGQTVGQGRIGRAAPHRTQGTDQDRARNIRLIWRFRQPPTPGHVQAIRSPSRPCEPESLIADLIGIIFPAATGS